jgi:hypothetical protein
MHVGLRLAVLLVCVSVLTCPGVAQTPPNGNEQRLLPRERELQLAESAGPSGVVRDATLYTLGREGYQVARSGSNGFSCLVGRERTDTLEPMCFDLEGSQAILPVVLDAAKFRGEGLSEEEINRRIAEGFQAGRYRAPQRAGITYMLSRENLVFNGQKVISYPPHVMIFAPYVTNKDIGADFKNRWLPWVLAEGTPHAYIMVVVREETSGGK